MVVSAAAIQIWCPLRQSTWWKNAEPDRANEHGLAASCCARMLPSTMTRASAFRKFGLLGGESPCPPTAPAAFCHRSRKSRPTTRGAGGCWPSPSCRTFTGGRCASCRAFRHFGLSLAGPIEEPGLRDCEMMCSLRSSRLLWGTHLARRTGFGTIRPVNDPVGNK